MLQPPFPGSTLPSGTGHFVAIVSQDFIRNYPRWIRENEQPLLAVFSTNGPSGRKKRKKKGKTSKLVNIRSLCIASVSLTKKLLITVRGVKNCKDAA